MSEPSSVNSDLAPVVSSIGSRAVHTTYHMKVNIAGVLRWPDEELVRLFTGEDGEKVNGRTVRDWLRLQLAHGKRVLPLGEKCEGWSDVDGCPGHRQETGDRRQESGGGI